MEKIDIQNFKKYYRNNDGNGTVARVGHLNYVIDGLTAEIAEAVEQNNILTTGLAAASGFNKINNYNLTVQGTELDVYSLQGFTQLSGSNTYIYPLGYLITNSFNVFASNNSSVVFANDSFLQQVLTSLGVGALVTDADPLSVNFGEVFPVSLMAINIDNTITTPDEYYIFLIAADSVPFECNAININLELAAVAGSTVEYNVI
jgi:hypothetical protein